MSSAARCSFQRGQKRSSARAKETREIDGLLHVLEHAIYPGAFLVHAQMADRRLVLTIARNFSLIITLGVNDPSDGALGPQNVVTFDTYVDGPIKVHGNASPTRWRRESLPTFLMTRTPTWELGYYSSSPAASRGAGKRCFTAATASIRSNVLLHATRRNSSA